MESLEFFNGIIYSSHLYLFYWVTYLYFCMICQHYLYFSVTYFSLNIIFWWREELNFDIVHFYSFFLYWMNLCFINKNSLSYSLTYPNNVFQSYIISPFTFRSIIHLKFTFLCGMTPCINPIGLTSFTKTLVFSHCTSPPPFL